MKPIARAMTAALSVLVVTTTACATAGDRARRAGVTPDPERPRSIAATAEGFVIRAAASSAPGTAERGAVSAMDREHIQVGSGTHLDVRLLSRPASPHQEILHAHR
ncbi:hypothetical protein [Sphingobium cloacae]|uniref:Uncharacterized protein n=1 Tax=Sphingobium cloacae TaxID=120107 RepID=A0A1E1EY81_9SPHN|nr:hypothetical protein [Sphingobium cloacae]BAV63227.1 hypothetical protein SCLO_1001870 [Sphingobium cloacae]